MNPRDPNLHLICVQGEHRGSSWKLGEKSVIIGRGHDCDIALADALVSRRQCSLVADAEGVLLEDLGSKNPCLVNGMPARTATLRPGDELSIVHDRFIVGLSQPGTQLPSTPSRDTVTARWMAPPSGAAPGRNGLVVRAQTIEELAAIHNLALELGDCACRAELVSLFLQRLRPAIEAERLWLGVYREDGQCALLGETEWPNATADPFAMRIAEEMRKNPAPFVGPRTLAFGAKSPVFSTIAVPVLAMSRLVATLIAECDCAIRTYGSKDLHEVLLAAQTLAPFLKMASELQALRQDYSLLSARTGTNTELLGESVVMRRLRERLLVAGRSALSVLLVGETGTGKELAARLVHQASSRAEAPLVTVNCAAIPESLLESELFGYARGAFTGAITAREGLFAEAHRGTLFLDEVGDLSPRNQARILRAIETGTFRPVGSAKDRQVDVRIVAVTNVNLQEAIERGCFRGDLFHRLCGVEIQMPPLSTHPEDIPLLLRHFLVLGTRELGLPEQVPTKDIYEAAVRHSWPGNVRELRNATYRALVESSTDGTSFLDVFLPDLRDQGESSLLPRPLAESERDAIVLALEYYEGNVTQASTQLGISRSSLYAKIREYGIKR